MIEFRRATAQDEALVLRLDAVCFPLDAPPVFAGAQWFIGWEGETPGSHCAWKIVEHDGVPVGFHYRGGVMPDYRGHGCLLYTSPSPRDGLLSRMPSSA